MGFKQHSNLLLTPQVPSGFLDHMVQVLQQLGPVEDLFPVLGHTQFHVTWYMNQGNKPK